MLKNLQWTLSLSLLGLTVFVVGCADDDPAKNDVATTASVPNGGEAEDDHQHGGWWCPEHGVPEGECSRCDSSLIAGFKEKGDWCKEHDLPESQCFKCDPKRAEKFIARYEAKYGKKPPKQTE